MASTADFYVGRGHDAEWLGSIAWDGLPAGLPASLRSAATPEAFRAAVTDLVAVRSDGVTPDKGWPWKWDTSHGTAYTYAFDKDRVWTCCFGSSWWKATAPEPDHTTLTRKAAKLPDMSLHRLNVSLFEPPAEKPKRPKRSKKVSPHP